MNVCCTNTTGEIDKKPFNIKPIRKDGLVLQIHHTLQHAIKTQIIEKRVRFLYTAFDSSGLVVANADIEGNIFIVDFSAEKFWSLPKLNSCTVLAFSPLQTSDLITGHNSGDLYIFNVHLGTVSGFLQGHKNPVKSISFANDLCLTASSIQAIIFDLKTLTKVHELTIHSPTTLKQPAEELNLSKLQGILKEYGEYPESYRALIWTKILLLPNNFKSYASIMKKGYNENFNNIDRKYPLVNKSVLKNLKRLLSNLGNWCSIFCHIDFLPLFVFPFVKVFENEPQVCFEAVVTIILNWCQHWFEYVPCAPINTLAIIENILAEHDPQLLAFLTSKGVTSHQYAWIMLQTAFTEILTIKEWLILWDHILSNEPAFMLMVPVAYNVLSRNVLATLTTVEDFESFYGNQNPVGVEKLISKSYFYLNKTSEKNHPRKYLSNFVKLPVGSYPLFEDYPKVMLNIVNGEMNYIQQTEDEITKVKAEIENYKEAETERQNDFRIKEEETKRLQQLEDIYQEKVAKERERVDKRKMELSKLKTNLMEMQAESIEVSRRKLEEKNYQDRKRELDKMLQTIDYNQIQDDLDIQQTEEDLSKHYVELLRQKTILENMLLQSIADDCLVPDKFRNIELQRQKVRKELEQIRNNVNFNRLINKVNIPVGISVANDRTQHIDMALAKEEAAKKMHLMESHGKIQVLKMENDTQELENEVQNLLDKFTNSKICEANYLLNRLTKSVSDRGRLMTQEKQFLKGKTNKKSSTCRNCTCSSSCYC